MRGGRREGSGRKKKPIPEPISDKGCAARLIEALNREPRNDDSYEIKEWRKLWDASDLRIRLDTRKFLYEKRDGKAIHTVNHLHDKPLDVNVSLSVSERMMKALERAEARVRNR